MQPLAAKVARGKIEPRSRVVVEKSESSDELIIHATGRVEVPALKLSVLLVDDNRELTQFLENWMIGAEWKVFIAENGEQAREAFNREKPKVLMVDSMLSDGDGMELAMYFRRRNAKVLILLMADEELDAEERAMCQGLDINVLRKPFLASYIMGLIRNRFQPISSAAKA
jgi:DNA-binding response OmpR family regulator